MNPPTEGVSLTLAFWEESMPTEAELKALLARTRKWLDAYLLTEDGVCRDDVAELCSEIDDATVD